MADITARNQGEVEDSGKVNWRGDQVAAPQGGQSIYKNSTVQLAQLGSRKVVGDRVFRYTKAAGAITMGDLIGGTLPIAGEVSVPSASSDTGVVGSKVFNLYSTTALTLNELSEGYMIVQTGSTPGAIYRIKTNTVCTATATSKLNLYDTIHTTFGATSEVAVIRNQYAQAIQYDTNGIPIGVAPITATTNDYFWLQTWGPACIKHSGGNAVQGFSFVGAKTGAVQDIPDGTGEYHALGYQITVATGSEHNLGFLQIAP